MYYISYTKSLILDIEYRKATGLKQFVESNFYVGDNNITSISMHTVRFGFNHITLAIL